MAQSIVQFFVDNLGGKVSSEWAIPKIFINMMEIDIVF